MITIDFSVKSEVIPEYVVDKYGVKRLLDENGRLHSYNDMPAIITTQGIKHWYKHGKFIRLKFPDEMYINYNYTLTRIK